MVPSQSSTLGGQKLSEVPVPSSHRARFHAGMRAAAADRIQIEAAAVTRWRLHELLRAGYTWDQGVKIAPRPDVDLHQAVDLLRKGCPPETAVRILL
jgi:hypothetical protein